MRRAFKNGGLLLLLLVMTMMFGITAQAKEDTLKKGIFAENIDLSGMNVDDAKAAVQQRVDSLRDVEVTLLAADDHEVTVTAGDLGIYWKNPEIIDEAAGIGTRGNIIQRYKMLKDLEYTGQVYDIKLGFSVEDIDRILAEKCVKYDQKAINATLQHTGGGFNVVAGQTGYVLDVESSIDAVYDYLAGDWDRTPCRIPLDIEVDEPRGKAEDLAQITDVLGTFTTSYSTSGTSRRANVENGCRLINGTTLYPGEEFSTYKTVSPFSEANGYYMAGSYMNGKVVDSLGGGICQVSTTLYNAVLLAELDVTERNNHSMIVNYVSPSADAAIAESAGKDFRFVNNTDSPIYIEGVTYDKKITFTIYGKETRDKGHKVRYESEVIEEKRPETDLIYPAADQPIGYIVTESAHIGYKARLWKIVTENGVEVSKEQVNSSNYKMSPRSATVGTASADPNAQAEIMAAIGTGSIDHVKAVIKLLTAPAPAATPAPVYDDDDEDE